MNPDVYAARAMDLAIAEAAYYLEIERGALFDLAERWEELGPKLWAETTPETFYTAWQGEAGQANLCRNLIDQYARRDVWAVLWQVTQQLRRIWMLDFGCGSAALSWALRERCEQLVLADVPNAAREFVRWRIETAGARHVASVGPDEALQLPAESFTLIACIDVLEHLPEPTAVFERLDALLAPGGVFVYRAPWARDDEDFDEHLPAATADWHRPGGGAEQLAERYTQAGVISHGGVFVKR